MQQTNAKRPCPKCGNINRPGVIFCENCGTQVGTGLMPSSRPRPLNVRPITDEIEPDTSMTETIYARKKRGGFQPGTSVFDEKTILKIEIDGINEPLILRPFEGRAILLGRYDPDDSYQPDIDLVPFEGHRLGISRRHAAITLSGKRLEVRDLQSSNGTYLNDVLLDANEPHQIRDGDQLRLGNMVLNLSFQL